MSKDSLDCDVLVVAGKSGYLDLFNISKGFKQFTFVMAYSDGPVNQAITILGQFGMDKGMITVSDDG